MKEPSGMELFVLWLYRHRLKQRDAAKGIGTHKNYLSSVIRGARPLSLSMAKKLETWMRSKAPEDFIHASTLLRLTPPHGRTPSTKEDSAANG